MLSLTDIFGEKVINIEDLNTFVQVKHHSKGKRLDIYNYIDT